MTHIKAKKKKKKKPPNIAIILTKEFIFNVKIYSKIRLHQLYPGDQRLGYNSNNLTFVISGYSKREATFVEQFFILKKRKFK